MVRDARESHTLISYKNTAPDLQLFDLLNRDLFSITDTARPNEIDVLPPVHSG